MPGFVYAMIAAPFALITVAVMVKYLQVGAARRWPLTSGVIVAAAAEQREVKVPDASREDGHRFETRNFANIVYEYSVGGQVMRHGRVGIIEDRGNFRVAETIARYPVGAAVTVYYNPRQPSEAVLERDLPAGMMQAMIICAGAVVVIAVVMVASMQGITGSLGAQLAHPQLSVPVVALAALGLAAALFARAMQRQAAQAARWPSPE